MRKQELVHLHALCAQVREHVEQRHRTERDLFVGYEDLGVGPNAVYRSKDNHRRAVFRLADGVTTVLEQEHRRRKSVADGGDEPA